MPGRAECSTRFLIQPVMPEENLPPVSTAASGAPPAGKGEGGACQLQEVGGGRPRALPLLEPLALPDLEERPQACTWPELKTYRRRCCPWC